MLRVVDGATLQVAFRFVVVITFPNNNNNTTSNNNNNDDNDTINNSIKRIIGSGRQIQVER